MRKSFQYKAKLSPSVERNAFSWLGLCRQLYNTALEQRIDAYKRCGKSVSRYMQDKELPNLKNELPEYKNVAAQTLQDVLEKLDKTYQSFFRRLKSGKKAGFPRFKGRDRYNSFKLKQSSWSLTGNKLTIRNIGTLKLFLSRPILGDIKTVTVKYTSAGWFVSFSCDNVPKNILPVSNKEIGLDVGLKVFLADSDGEFVDNPRFFRKSEKELRRKQRSLSRKKLRSKRRQKAKRQVQRIHEKVKNQRDDFIRKIAKKYVDSNGVIYVEALKVVNMVKNKYLSKSINDVSWNMFRQWLTFKAEEAGREVIAINPKNTSQTCLCGEIVKKSLAVRVHRCPVCGIVIDRDILAAKNILRFGQNRQVLTRPIGLVA